MFSVISHDISDMKHHKHKLALQDLDKICRLCLKKESGLECINLVDPIDQKVSVSDFLKVCISVDVSDNDCLPKNICVECINELSRIYYFRNRCKQSENTLRLILQTAQKVLDTKSNTEPNIYNDNDNNKQEEEEEEETIYIVVSVSDTDTPNDFDVTEVHLNDVRDENNILRETNNSNIDVNNETAFDYEGESSNDDDVSRPSFKADNNSNNELLPFTASDNLTHGPDKLKCRICNSSFPDKESLRDHSKKFKHLMSHRRLNMCEVCSKWVPSHRMRGHMLFHTNEKPFKCKACGTGFNSKSNLARHSTVHTGEKRFICEFCGNGFTQAGSLNTHKFTHHIYSTESTKKEVNLTCNICGRDFKRFNLYSRHLKGHENPNHLPFTKGNTFKNRRSERTGAFL